jgi:hypothetical protein
MEGADVANDGTEKTQFGPRLVELLLFGVFLIRKGEIN